MEIDRSRFTEDKITELILALDQRKPIFTIECGDLQKSLIESGDSTATEQSDAQEKPQKREEIIQALVRPVMRNLVIKRLFENNMEVPLLSEADLDVMEPVLKEAFFQLEGMEINEKQMPIMTDLFKSIIRSIDDMTLELAGTTEQTYENYWKSMILLADMTKEFGKTPTEIIVDELLMDEFTRRRWNREEYEQRNKKAIDKLTDPQTQKEIILAASHSLINGIFSLVPEEDKPVVAGAGQVGTDFTESQEQKRKEFEETINAQIEGLIMPILEEGLKESRKTAHETFEEHLNRVYAVA